MSAMKLNTISELAQLAGVSTATASRALAGSDLVNKKTRDKIIKIAEQYDFKPNELYPYGGMGQRYSWEKLLLGGQR